MYKRTNCQQATGNDKRHDGKETNNPVTLITTQHNLVSLFECTFDGGQFGPSARSAQVWFMTLNPV